MIKGQRQKLIIEQVNKDSFVSVGQLAKKFGVTTMTIQRDLKELAAKNLLITTYGGAEKIEDGITQIPYEKKQEKNVEIKASLGSQAASLIKDGQTILIAAGTTMKEIAKNLLHKNITVITVDLNIALLLSDSKSVKVHIIGGYVDTVSHATIDRSGLKLLSTFDIDYVFLGGMEWSIEGGVRSPSLVKAKLKSELLSLGHRKVLVIDSSKYAQSQSCQIAELNEFDVIITDEQLNTNLADALDSEGKFELILAKGN